MTTFVVCAVAGALVHALHWWSFRAWPKSAKRYPLRVQLVAQFSPLPGWSSGLEPNDVPGFLEYRKRAFIAYTATALYVAGALYQAWIWRERLEHLENGGSADPSWVE